MFCNHQASGQRPATRTRPMQTEDNIDQPGKYEERHYPTEEGCKHITEVCGARMTAQADRRRTAAARRMVDMLHI
eukprot:3029356-Rhodomonas_salina.2